MAVEGKPKPKACFLFLVKKLKKKTDLLSYFLLLVKKTKIFHFLEFMVGALRNLQNQFLFLFLYPL